MSFSLKAFFLLITLGSAHSIFAQATYRFSNYAPGDGLDAPVFDAGGNRLFGTNYVAVLYGGLTADSLELALVGGTAPMDPVPFLRVHNEQQGYFGRGGAVEVRSLNPGGPAWLQVRAWDIRMGTTYEEVAQLGLGGYGESLLFYTYGGDGTSTGIPSQPLRGLESFSLRPVPEPSTWALLAFGAGFLCWRCRRKR